MKTKEEILASIKGTMARSFPIERAKINAEERIVPILFSVGTPVVRYWGIEVLNMSPQSVRMATWKNSAPFFMNHDTRDQRGVILNGSLANNELRGDVKMSKSVRGAELLQDMIDGIRTHVSIGYMIHNARELKPEEMSKELKDLCLREGLPAIEVDDWEPFEGTSVYLGADTKTGVGRAFGEEQDPEFEQRVKAIIERNNNPQTTPTGGSDMKTAEQLAAEKEVRDAALVAERSRMSFIESLFTQFTFVEGIGELRAKALVEGWDGQNFLREIGTLRQGNAAEINAIFDQHRTVAGVDEDRAVALRDAWTKEKSRAAVMERVKKASPAVPGTAVPTDPVITGMRDMTPAWQHRAVYALGSMVATFRGNHARATQLRSKFDELERKVTQQEREAEFIAVRERIKNSGLEESQQYRLMSSLSAGAGAVLVPTPLLAEIFILVEKHGVARRYFRPVAMVADTLKLDNLVTEAIAYWVGQGSGITAADLVFGTGTLSVYKLAGISSWSSEIDEDAAIALLPIYIDSIARAIRKQEDLAGFIGDGTATYGSFTGLLPAAGLVLTLDAGKTQFQDADADDWKALRDKVNIDFRDGAGYFMSPDSVSGLEGQKDGQGRYIYREPAASLPAMLWGHPIFDSVGINALAALVSGAGKRFAAFGNPRHMLMAMKREMETVVSNEGILDNGAGGVVFNALQADGAIVRTTERIGFKLFLVNGIAVMKTAAV